MYPRQGRPSPWSWAESQWRPLPAPWLRQIQLKFPHLPGAAAQLLAGSGVAPSGRFRARRGAGRWLAVDADSLECGQLGYGSLELFYTAQGNCIHVRAQDSEVGDVGHNRCVHSRGSIYSLIHSLT